MPNKSILIVSILALAVIVLSQCISNSGSQSKDIRGTKYAGSASCKTCHQDIYNEAVRTAHFNTSSEGIPVELSSNFEDGKNIFEFSDSVKVVMGYADGKYHQTEYRNGQSVVSHSFDMTIGSGRKAQTFLYYDSNKIHQLPISYFILQHTWANSPGFPAGYPRFERSIPSTCFGCHSSFIAAHREFENLQAREEYEHGQIVYGIDCERCHGPGAEHIEFYSSHPKDSSSKFITTIRNLQRSRKDDLCAQCHSGLKDQQQSLFNFQPGDKLSDYYYPDFSSTAAENLDVHGNQAQLMMASKCYQLSDKLTCISCHNVHLNERNNLTAFSERCMNCHRTVKHSSSIAVSSNCIDCHMPLQPSKAITLLTNRKGSATADSIRTHLIKIYK